MLRLEICIKIKQFVFGGYMSSTLLRIILLGALFSAPLQASAFDFDKELAKQNNISVELVSRKGKVKADKASKDRSEMQVTLVARKR